MRILFQGDSITDAFRKPDEINPAFQLGNGYAFLIASRLAADHPERDYEFFNRGVSGNTIHGLAARWQEDALDLRPDLLSLLVGVNNSYRSFEGRPEATDKEVLGCYRSLLDQAKAQNAGLRLILLEPYLLEAGEVTAARQAMLVPLQEGMAAIAQEYGAIFLPLQSLFNAALLRAPAAYWAYDGVHATQAGFQLIADAWLASARAGGYV